jgi:hypothetical protein
MGLHDIHSLRLACNFPALWDPDPGEFSGSAFHLFSFSRIFCVYLSYYNFLTQLTNSIFHEISLGKQYCCLPICAIIVTNLLAGPVLGTYPD